MVLPDKRGIRLPLLLIICMNAGQQLLAAEGNVNIFDYSFIAYFLVALFLFLLYRMVSVQKNRQKSIIEKEQFERKKIEELVKLKIDFISNLSHEFRMPLSLIINSLEAMTRDTELSEATKEKLHAVLKNSYRLLKLTNELMDSGKPDKQPLSPDDQYYPKEPSLVSTESRSTKFDEEFMRKVTTFIESNLTNSSLSVDQLAQCVSLSKVQTYRKIKAISGLSIVEFIRAIRLKKAAQLILEKQMSFSEISFETGFSTPSYFSKCFHDHFGKTPSEYASDNG